VVVNEGGQLPAQQQAKGVGKKTDDLPFHLKMADVLRGGVAHCGYSCLLADCPKQWTGRRHYRA